MYIIVLQYRATTPYVTTYQTFDEAVSFAQGESEKNIVSATIYKIRDFGLCSELRSYRDGRLNDIRADHMELTK
jgi:hypothetical protein